MKSDLFLTRAIPSSLRDTGHPDKELVLMAITYALTAFKDANTMTATDATIAKHVHDALVTFEEKVFKPHLSKEDEDWNALKAEAARAMPVLNIDGVEIGRRKPDVYVMFRFFITGGEYDKRGGSGTVIRSGSSEGLGGMYTATVSIGDKDAEAMDEDAIEAVKKASMSMGFILGSDMRLSDAIANEQARIREKEFK